MVAQVGIHTFPLARVTYGQEEIDAVVATLMAGQTTCGPRVAEFERVFADYIGRDHAVMVNSGSSADLLVAFGLGPAGPGDEVLVPAVTWPTQVWSCLMAGYRVRLIDCDPDTLQVDLNALEAAWSPARRATFLVHVLGNVADMDAVQRISHGTVLEDCCEALGARWRGRSAGTFGQAAAFSFFFSHLINTMEGGMIVTDDDPRQYRLWRNHGWEPKKDYRFWFPTWGLNIRPMEIQGAFGLVQMESLDSYRAARARNYERLTDTTASEHLKGVTVLPDCEPSWHGFPLMVRDGAPFSRDQLCAYLEEHRIETRPIIAGNLARQPAVMNDPRIISGFLPGADTIHRCGFYIGLPSFDDPQGTAYVGEVVHDFMRQW